MAKRRRNKARTIGVGFNKRLGVTRILPFRKKLIRR